MERPPVVLCVDDEQANLNLFFHAFRKDFQVLLARSAEEALETCRDQEVDLVITDQRMPGQHGVDLLACLAEEQPNVVRILVTGYTDLSTAIDAINRGKVHRYVTKPWDPAELESILRRELGVRALRLENIGLTEELRKQNLDLEEKNLELVDLNRRLEARSLEYKNLYRELQDQVRQNQTLRRTVKESFSLRDLVGRSKRMREVFQIVRDVAETDSSVLILGETGTGKELVARSIHAESHRRSGPFVAVNCPGFPSQLLDAELFGHERGAFTGAIRQKKGRFELAEGGTLFLDEIGDIAENTQLRLLRVLQERSFERLGGEKTLKANVRIVSATNRDLHQAMVDGGFRRDLFYRLNVISIEMPPLRDRPEDIPLLCEHFLTRHSVLAGKDVPEIPPEAMRVLLDYHWPGNVRELENTIERAVALGKGDRLEADILTGGLSRNTEPRPDRETLRDMEVRMIRDSLEKTGWNKHKAARLLGINRSTLYGKMRRFGILPPSGVGDATPPSASRPG